jgi:hypothetical protein
MAPLYNRFKKALFKMISSLQYRNGYISAIFFVNLMTHVTNVNHFHREKPQTEVLHNIFYSFFEDLKQKISHFVTTKY